MVSLITNDLLIVESIRTLFRQLVAFHVCPTCTALLLQGLHRDSLEIPVRYTWIVSLVFSSS